MIRLCFCEAMLRLLPKMVVSWSEFVWEDVIVVLMADGNDDECGEWWLNFENGRVEMVRTFEVNVLSMLDRSAVVRPSGSFGLVSNVLTFEALAAAALVLAVPWQLLFVAIRTLL